MLHGEAVAVGMRCAARLAQRLGRVDMAFVQRQDRLLDSLYIRHDVSEIDAEDLIRLMYRDKKVADGRLRFVLPDRFGHVDLVEDVPDELVVGALES
jgi:3-dehydroquinate synthase